MAYKLSPENIKNLTIMLGADALALIVALYHQFRKVEVQIESGTIPIQTATPSRWAWIIFVVMLALTFVYYLICREEEVIKGLPPKRGEFDDDEDETSESS